MNSSKEVIKLIKQLRERKKLSVEELAKRVGVAKSTLSRYENEQRTFPINDIGNYANALNTSVEFLLGISKKETKNNLISMFDYRHYPTPVSAGLPIELDGVTENNVETISLPDSIMGKWAGRDDIYIMRINGDSMNRIMPHNSLIAVKTVELSELKNDDIVVYSDGGDYAVKRFYQRENEIIFKPDSKDVMFSEYRTTTDNDELLIHGRVVLYIAELD